MNTNKPECWNTEFIQIIRNNPMLRKYLIEQDTYIASLNKDQQYMLVPSYDENEFILYSGNTYSEDGFLYNILKSTGLRSDKTIDRLKAMSSYIMGQYPPTTNTTITLFEEGQETPVPFGADAVVNHNNKTNNTYMNICSIKIKD